MMRLEATQRIKATVLACGKRLDERRLASLRSALGYLEIGSLVKRLGNGSDVPMLHDRFDVFGTAVREVNGDHPLYLEFGVFEGETMRWWSQHLDQPDAQLVGFDSFVGLPEGWRPGFDTGKFATEGAPDVDDERVSFVAGWFDETLPEFKLPEHDQLVVNVDCDLYASAVTVLSWVEPHLKAGTLLYFDELADRDHELRALTELLARTSLTLVPLAVAGGGTHALFRVA
jgi:Methyltransferase domain